MKNPTLLILCLILHSFCCDAQSGWTNYNKDNSPLLDNRVSSVAIDHDNNLWGAYAGAGGLGNGVVKFDGTNWTHYNTSNSGLPSDDVRDIAIDSKGNIWFAFYNAGIVRFNGTTWVHYDTSNSGIAGDDVVDIEFDANGNLWIGDYFSGVSKFDGELWTTYTKDNAPFAEINCISDLTIDKENNVWVGMDCSGGMAKLSSISGTWTGYQTSNSNIPDHTVRSLQADASGVIWASHINVNVTSFNGTTWTIYNEQKAIDKFALDDKGGVWGAGYGLFKFEEGGWNKIPIPEAADTTYAFDVAVGKTDNIWLSTYSGLWINKKNTPPVFKVAAITVDQDFEAFKVKAQPADVPESEQWQKVSYSLVNPDEKMITATIDKVTGEITLTSVGGAFGKALLWITAKDGQVENNIYEVLVDITIEPTKEVVTGIEDSTVGEVDFFPNPISTTLSCITTRSSGIVVMNDMMGREVRRFVMTTNHPYADVSDLPPGIYLVKLVQDHGVSKIHKIVKREMSTY